MSLWLLREHVFEFRTPHSVLHIAFVLWSIQFLSYSRNDCSSFKYELDDPLSQPDVLRVLSSAFVVRLRGISLQSRGSRARLDGHVPKHHFCILDNMRAALSCSVNCKRSIACVAQTRWLVSCNSIRYHASCSGSCSQPVFYTSVRHQNAEYITI